MSAHAIPQPGTRCLFTLSQQDPETEKWSERTKPCEIKGRVVTLYAPMRHGHAMFETVMVLPDGEDEARPVNVARYVGPV